jgi:hypothetical protein
MTSSSKREIGPPTQIDSGSMKSVPSSCDREKCSIDRDFLRESSLSSEAVSSPAHIMGKIKSDNGRSLGK